MSMSSGWRPSSGSVMCHVYPDHPPILGLWDHDGVGLTITVVGGRVSADELDFAQQLSRKAAMYARECERWAANSEKQEAPEAAPDV